MGALNLPLARHCDTCICVFYPRMKGSKELLCTLNALYGALRVSTDFVLDDV